MRILRGSKHLTANTTVHWFTWLGSIFSVALVAYVVASGIPIFGGLGPLSALLWEHSYPCSRWVACGSLTIGKGKTAGLSGR